MKFVRCCSLFSKNSQILSTLLLSIFLLSIQDRRTGSLDPAIYYSNTLAAIYLIQNLTQSTTESPTI